MIKIHTESICVDETITTQEKLFVDVCKKVMRAVSGCEPDVIEIFNRCTPNVCISDDDQSEKWKYQDKNCILIFKFSHKDKYKVTQKMIHQLLCMHHRSMMNSGSICAFVVSQDVPSEDVFSLGEWQHRPEEFEMVDKLFTIKQNPDAGYKIKEKWMCFFRRK